MIELNTFFDKMEQGSLKTLEEAARQIITLSTALLAAFFGLLAFTEVPPYLKYMDVKVLGVLAAAFFFAALLAALFAVLPKRYDFPRASLTEKRRILDNLLSRKDIAVQVSTWLFGAGALLLFAATLDILLFSI